MYTRRELRDGELYQALSLHIAHQRIVTIQVVTASGQVVDCQHDVVPNAATRDIDTTLIPQTCHEIGGGIDLPTGDKSSVIQVKLSNQRTYRILFGYFGSTAHQIVTECPLRLSVILRNRI